MSQGFPQLGNVNSEMAKQAFIHTRLLHAYLTLARLFCFILVS